MVPAASSTDDFAGLRISLATVTKNRDLQVTEAESGIWCGESLSSDVKDVPEGKTYAPPAMASGGGVVLVAWLADERFDWFSVKVRFAIRDAFGAEWDVFGETGLPGTTKRIAVGYSASVDRFVLTYLDERFDGNVKLINPQTGEVSGSSFITKGLDSSPLNDIGRPSCYGATCRVPITFAGGSLAFGVAIGGVSNDGFEPDEFGDPPFFIGATNIGRGESAMRGTGSDGARWYTHHESQPFDSGSRPWKEFIVGGDGMLTLPYPMTGCGPGLHPLDDSPDWSGAMGTYAGLDSSDPLRAMIFRAQGDSVTEPASDAIVGCCTEVNCPQIPPEDDVELGGCADVFNSLGEIDCPCAPISTVPEDLEGCAIAGDPTDANCQQVIPDGRFPDLYCPDSDGTLVCDKTQAGNSICRKCGDGGTFGCPCDEVDCQFEGLGCWGEDFGPNPTPSEGRCWETTEPPDHACVEVCHRLQPAFDGFSLVCVGPHLGEHFTEGSPYNLTQGDLAGHPSYCSSIDCVDPIDPDLIGGYCERESNGHNVCVAEDTCDVECLLPEDCALRGYPEWYVCVQNGVNRCLPLSACDGKPEACG